jgi:hypothetical protein
MEKKFGVIPKLRGYILKDSCGCAMGARFLFAGLMIAIPYYILMYQQKSIGGTAAFTHAFLFIFIVSGIGKATGLLLYRMMNKRIKQHIN